MTDSGVLIVMKTHPANLKPDIMLAFPSGTAAPTFPDWVANHVGLEQFLALAGFLEPELYEVKGHVFWDRHVAERLEYAGLASPYGEDPVTIERYFNTINLAEFFLLAADDAIHSEQLIRAFGRVLQHFWGASLRARFPDRSYRLEVASDLYDEEGLCLTFWQER